MKNRWAQ